MTELNHHTDPSGLLRSAGEASSGKPFLGNLETVDSLVRMLGSDVVERFGKVGDGLMTPHDAADLDKAECHKLARILTGYSKEYTPVPGWTNGGLARSIRKKMAGQIQPSESDVGVVEQALAVFVHHVYHEVGDLGKGQTEARAQESLSEGIRSTSHLLIGLDHHE